MRIYPHISSHNFVSTAAKQAQSLVQGMIKAEPYLSRFVRNSHGSTKITMMDKFDSALSILRRWIKPRSSKTTTSASSSTDKSDPHKVSNRQQIAQALRNYGEIHQGLNDRFRAGYAYTASTNHPGRIPYLAIEDGINNRSWSGGFADQTLMVGSYYAASYSDLPANVMLLILRVKTDRVDDISGVDARSTIYTHVLAWKQKNPGEVLCADVIYRIFKSIYGNDIIATVNAQHRAITQLDAYPEGRDHIRNEIFPNVQLEQIAQILED